MTPRVLLHAALCAAVVFSSLSAQTPPPPAKRLPPAGVAIPDQDRAELTAGAAELGREIEALRGALRAASAADRLLALLPDVEVFHKAVDWALRYDEFFDPKQIALARKALATGRQRAAQLRAGQSPWLDATGLIVRGHRSRLDDSVQPYGLVVPESWRRERPGRLQVWLLGRGEKRSELGFIGEREAGPPQLVPRDTLILVPYGRYCNATKFAGEVDVFEAMDAVKAHYAIDENRISVAGFSMGGASTWHLAAHHPGRWCVAAPGAGFAETPVYAKVFAAGKPARTPWEPKLWHWYNATDYAANFFNLPLVAYSGEIDPQKQAADIMAAALAKEGLALEHLIGPQTAHKYHPETKTTLTARLEALVDKGRDPRPAEVRFTTHTLRYSKSHWVQIAGLEKHWERADVRARIADADRIRVETKNVSALRLTPTRKAAQTVEIDGQTVRVPSFERELLVKEGGHWKLRALAAHQAGLAKRPGLTGPIDDAFMEPVIFVRPTGRPLHETVGRWVDAELAHAVKMWRDIFRAEIQVKADTAVSDEDIARKNLVLWGDAASNAIIAKIVASGKVPLTWDAKQLTFRGKPYDAAHHAPVLIFPNPLNRGRYIVLNSGVDFRDEAYGTNSLQTPKLPDFAIIDLREPPGPRWPGKIVEAGFFDEAWR